MASKSDPITRELSSFFKQAASALDEVKESVIKGGQATKASVDVQLLKRSRERALARLGEVLLEEHARGAPLPPACDEVVKEIHGLDEQLATARAEADKLWKSDAPPAAARPAAAHSNTDDDDE